MATREQVYEQYQRELKRRGPDAASTKMWKERLRQLDAGTANQSASQAYFSGHSRPVDR